MSQYDNTNKGAAWKKRPGAADNAPDWKIQFNLNGEDHEIAIWTRRPTDNQDGPNYKFKIEKR